MSPTRLLLLAACCVLAACPQPPDAAFSQTIVWKQADGLADDAATMPAEATYNTDGGRAEDDQSLAGSHVIKWDYLGGYVHAVPADQPNEQEETARASSRNKVQSELVINKAGNYTLQTSIELSGMQIIGDASLRSSVSVTIYNTRNRPITDVNGDPVQNRTFQGQGEFKINAGNLEVTPSGGTLTGGKFTHSYATRAGGVNLAAGTYWVQMELNLSAVANTSWQAPAPKPQAHIDTAKLKLSLR